MDQKCPILDSHLSCYLLNNQAPTEEDDKTVRALRECLNAEILTIQEHQTGTSYAKHDKDNVNNLDALRCSLSRCQIILSPWRRLPREIWGEIFVRCRSTHRHPILNPKEAPLLLTNVSPSWRAIAISTPELWTRLDVRLHPHPNKRPAIFHVNTGVLEIPQDVVPQDQITQWLQLAGSLPLKVDLSAPYASRPDGWQSLLLKIIFAFSNQLQCLSLNLFISTSYQNLSIRAAQFPLLETLSIRSANRDELLDPDSIFYAAKLRNLTIRTVPFQWQNIPIPNTWSKLNKLIIHSMIDGSAATKILIYCGCLVHCSLKVALIITEEPTDSDVIPIIFRPALQYLSILDPGKGVRTPNSIFRGLHPPNLRHFEWAVDYCDCINAGTSSGVVSFNYFLRQIPHMTPISESITTRNFLPRLDKLETLVLSNIDNSHSPDAVLCFLQHLPSGVKTLTLGHELYTPELVGCLFQSLVLQLLSTLQQNGPSTDPKFLLPNLQSITYYGYISTFIQSFIFARTSLRTKSDQGPSRPLKEFVAYIYREDLAEMEIVKDQVVDHIKSMGIPFTMEIDSCGQVNDQRLFTKFDFDPQNPEK